MDTYDTYTDMKIGIIFKMYTREHKSIYYIILNYIN